MKSAQWVLYPVVVALALGVWSCEFARSLDFFTGQGMKPVYVPLSALNDVRNLPPQPIQQTGSIFLRDTLFFMLEQRKGIHLFSIADTLNPRALTFWKIPSVTGFTLSGNRLFADSWRDLVTIDISNIYNIRVVDRQVNAFEPLLFPPNYNGHFECVDETKGAVAGWEEAQIFEAKCRTIN